MKLAVRSARAIVILCAVSVATILGIQLVASTAWQADAANAGPTVVILQLSGDTDTDWATQELMGRLSSFITDDPFFVDRLILIKTCDPSAAKSLDASVVIYMSHGGPQGIVTGSRLTSWKAMAGIVEDSKATLHLFAACESRRLISYGIEESAKKLYTVPGVRPAEVTNVEIASAVMLALGINSQMVEQYRTTELTTAKELVQSGCSVHIMDFEQVILDEIEYVDAHYSDTYTDEYMVLRSSTWVQLSGPDGFNALPLDLRDLIVDYYKVYFDIYGVPYLRTLMALSVNYTRNYYQEATWIPDGGPDFLSPPGAESYSQVYIYIAPRGHWEYGPLVFCGGTYSGVVVYSGDGSLYTQVWVNVTASGSVLDSVDSISLNQIGAGGVYVSRQKVDGIWSEPVVGRNPGRTGGLWTDSCGRSDYEYDSSWPNLPGYTQATGSIGSTGTYLTVTNIPTGTSWHGPSFVMTLPSYFKMKDLGSFSANLSLVHSGQASRVGVTFVALYDSNKKLAVLLYVADSWTDTAATVFTACYYNEDGTSKSLQSNLLTGDVSGVVQIRFDPLQGLFADVPGKDELWLYCYTQINTNRIIKYVAIQSYRYGSLNEHDERIYSLRLSYAYSDYTVFHDACNDMYEFQKDLTFPYGPPSEGVLEVPSGQSYMKWTSIVSGISGWHGPQYVHVLDRPFRLYQLSDFSVIGELVQSSYTMGQAYVGLFDENKECVMLVYWGDAWYGSQKGWFNLYYFEDGASYSQASGYIYTNFQKTAKIWWDPWQGGDGAIWSTIDGSGSGYPIAEVNNCSRIIKYVVTVGQRYSSYTLVDMRIHDVNVVADLTTHDPAIYDGTDLGVGQTADPPDADWVQHVNSWWTIPWPELHTRVEKYHPSGSSLVVQVKSDLLGSRTLETLAATDDMGNSIQTLDNSAIVNAAMQLIIDNLVVMAGLYLIELFWASACFASNSNPGWIPFAVALGFDWMILYTYSITILEASLRNSGFDPWFRFWVLLLTGLVFCFGAFCLTFGYVILGSILAGKDVTEALLSILPGGWILFVFKCIACFALVTAALYTRFVP